MQNQPYNISDDFMVFESMFPLPDELREELHAAQNKLYKENNTSVLTKFKRLQKKYPNNPHLLCDIGTYYAVRKNHNKAIELYQQVIDSHEGYTFAYINKAQMLIDLKKYDESANCLGEDFQISNLLPDRKVFYIEEVKSFINVCIQHFLFQGYFNEAEKKVVELEELDPSDERVQVYRSLLSFTNMNEEYDDDDIEIPELPSFNTPLVEHLFEFGNDIPIDLIEELLTQDRQMLIKDLEKVLNYAQKHSAFFIDNIRYGERNTFVLHAFLLLGELNSKESLEKCIDFLSLDEYTLDYWLGDYKSETLWQVFYKFNIDLLFLKDYIITNYKNQPYFINIADALLCNAGLIKPETKLQIASIYKDLLEFIDSLDPDKDLIDGEVNSLFVASCLDLNLKTLLPLIEKIYKDKKVDELMCGDIEEVKYEFENSAKQVVTEVSSLPEIYSFFENEDDYYDEDMEDDYDIMGDSFNGDLPGINDPYHGMVQYMGQVDGTEQNKVGRNDPCPCGSGKKYKKCCLAK